MKYYRNLYNAWLYRIIDEQPYVFNMHVKKWEPSKYSIYEINTKPFFAKIDEGEVLLEFL